MAVKTLNRELQTIRDLFPLEAQEVITRNRSRNDIVIIDVSTHKEFKTAHLENAVNINYFSKLFKLQLDLLDRNKTYLVYCRMGGRSKLAQKIMKKLEFRTVYNIIGGALLWEEEGLPFESGKRPSKWIPCPFSITMIVTRKIRKLLQTAYGSFVDAWQSVRL